MQLLSWRGENVSVDQVVWSDQVAKSVARAAGEDLEQIAIDAENNLLQIWQVKGDYSNGYIVTRIDKTAAYTELLIVLGEGKNIMRLMPFMLWLKDLIGAGRITVHLSDDRLIRSYSGLGFKKQTTVMSYG